MWGRMCGCVTRMVEERRGTEGWNRKRRTVVYFLALGGYTGHALLWDCVTHLQRVQMLRVVRELAGCRMHIDYVVAPW